MQEICRTCCTIIRTSTGKNIFEPKYADILTKIELVSGVVLPNDADLPNLICSSCFLDLHRAAAFRERCIKSQEQLHQNRTKTFETPNEQLIVEIDELSDYCDIKDAKDQFTYDDQTDDDGEDCEFLVENIKKELYNIIEYKSEDEEDKFSNHSYSNDDNNSLPLSPFNAPMSEASEPEHQQSNNFIESPAKSLKVGDISKTNNPHRDKKKYVTWKNLTEDEIVERKRNMRRRNCICDQCGRQFNDQSNFKLHMLRHSGVKNFICNICDKSFYTEHLLSLHDRIVHKNERPYACKYCSKTFNNSTTRVIHERSTHTNIRPYSCNHCRKKFSSTSGLKRHELIHSGLRPFQCVTCDQSFQRKTHLNAHYRSKLHKQKATSYAAVSEYIIYDDES